MFHGEDVFTNIIRSYPICISITLAIHERICRSISEFLVLVLTLALAVPYTELLHPLIL